ncbi:acyltransferase family protein [Actinosynnema sp. NPDC059797]
MTGRARRYRPELQGLRALAVTLVVVYHVWLGRVSGGVDVFFLLSGFLVTGQLVRAAERGRIEPVPLWGRMVKRLFPAALTVLLALVAVCVVALPENRWFQTIREVVAAALYLENWQLVSDAADYFQQHDEASVVQHYWSLSIQGQFYLVWPLLVVTAAWAARRLGTGVRRPVAWLLVAVFGGSLAFSVVLTGADQPLAYFHSLTRAWEFALGGLLALVVDAVVLNRGARVVLGWLGVVGLVACGLVLKVGSVFPGYAALWPTLCGAAVVVAGATGSRVGADRLLSARPVRYVGDLSYALYLWHWPVLVLYLVLRGREEVGPLGGAFVIGLSVVLAVATHHLVEAPVRRSRVGEVRAWRAHALGAAAMVPVLLAAGAWQAVSDRKAASYELLVDDNDHPGALARMPDFEYWGSEDATVIPPLVSLYDDFPAIEGSTCRSSPRNPRDLEVCTSPGPAEPARRIAVVGDSHMQSYLAALWPIARERDWQVVSMLKGACPFSTDADAAPGDARCTRWNADVVDELAELRPDLVLVNGTRNVRVGLTETTPDGFVAQWRELAEVGLPVLAVRDNPRFSFGPAECAAAHGLDPGACATPRADLLTPEPPWSAVPDLPPNVSFADFSDYICEDETCPAIIGNVFVYLDDNHLSATYAATLAPFLEAVLLPLLGLAEGEG